MDLKSLYQDVIVDHNRSPRNFRKIDPASHSAEGFNPLCGDKLHLYLSLDGETIEDVSFEGSGCAISVAAASMMTERLRGRTISEARSVFRQMHELLTVEQSGIDTAALGKLAAFAGVREYPSRVKCATLCWHTLNAALDAKPNAVSTE